jgi:hypothetical protein
VSDRRTPRPTGSLFVQLITLTGLTLVAAEAISLFLIFNLPPPLPDFYRLTEIEQTFHGAAPTFTERRPLEVMSVNRPPGPVMEGSQAPRIRGPHRQGPRNRPGAGGHRSERRPVRRPAASSGSSATGSRAKGCGRSISWSPPLRWPSAATTVTGRSCGHSRRSG